MRISYNWLKDYIDVKVPAERLAELLTMAGLPAESVQKMGDDSILELEVTANRPDWLSYIGVAREIAAITGKRLKPQSSLVPRPSSLGKRAPRPIVRVEDKKLCPRYTARVIRNVKVGQSPEWLRKKVEAMGLRAVNNIVDITNFCLFETGEPMHAFDLDKIEGGEVIVRRAKAGEKIVTIDGAERTLDGDMLIIADARRPIAIAGVMGGMGTEVGGSTKNVLLEAAYFDPVSIRRISRRLGLSSESSYRFERKVDAGNIINSSDRAAVLISELARGEAGGFSDIGGKTGRARSVSLRLSKLNSVLGVKIEASKVKKILASLGLKPKGGSKDKSVFEAPSWRADLNAEIDLIEEVARVYGYGNIPLTIAPIVEQPVRIPREIEVKRRIRSVLAACGCDEIITYNLLSDRSVKAAASGGPETVEIKNPLTSEQAVMAPTLIAGMLNAMVWNMNRKSKDLKFFEIGKTYTRKQGGGFDEREVLCLGLTGEARSDWTAPSRQVDFFGLKGIIETLLSELGIRGADFRPSAKAIFTPGRCAGIFIDNGPAGIIGEVCRKVAEGYDMDQTVYAAEIYLDVIIKLAKTQIRFRELERYPSVFRDISIVIDRKVPSSQIVVSIQDTGSPTLKEARLIDKYEGAQISEGKIGLTYRLEYQDPSRTLEEKEVSDIHSKILRELESRFGAQLRG